MSSFGKRNCARKEASTWGKAVENKSILREFFSFHLLALSESYQLFHFPDYTFFHGSLKSWTNRTLLSCSLQLRKTVATSHHNLSVRPENTHLQVTSGIQQWKEQGRASQNEATKRTARMSLPMQYGWAQKIIKARSDVRHLETALHTNLPALEPEKGCTGGPQAAAPYDSFVAFPACIRKAAATIECSKLGVIDAYIPRKIAINVIYASRGHLLYL